MRTPRSKACWLAAILIGFCGGPIGIPPLVAASAEMATYWRGSYFYTDGRPPVPFELELQITDGKVSGRTCEPATFGDFSKPYLRAIVEGTVTDTKIRFRKTYDGTGGVGHSVEYEGDVKSSGRELLGVWEIGQTRSGMRGLFNAIALPPNSSGADQKGSFCPDPRGVSAK